MGCFLPAVLTGEAPGCRRDGDVVGGGWRRPCGGEHGERNEQWVLRTGWGEQRAKEHGNMGDGGGVVLTRRNGVVRGAFEVDVGDVFVQKRCKTEAILEENSCTEHREAQREGKERKETQASKYVEVWQHKKEVRMRRSGHQTM